MVKSLRIAIPWKGSSRYEWGANFFFWQRREAMILDSWYAWRPPSALSTLPSLAGTYFTCICLISKETPFSSNVKGLSSCLMGLSCLYSEGNIDSGIA